MFTLFFLLFFNAVLKKETSSMFVPDFLAVMLFNDKHGFNPEYIKQTSVSVRKCVKTTNCESGHKITSQADSDKRK